jgi:hypothetical protein
MKFKAIAVSLALVLTPSLALAANPPQLIGDWKGVLDIEGMKLTLVFHVGADQATADSPDQGALNLPVEVGRNSSAYTLGIPMVAGNFEGELSADGKTLTGAFYQNEVSPQLVLTRTSTTPTLPAPMKPAPAEIKGDWEGKLQTPNGTIALLYHLTDKPTAELPGAPGPLPARVDKVGDDYSVDVVGAVFKGKLSADGKTLAGTMSQGGQGGPLTLTRK